MFDIIGFTSPVLDNWIANIISWLVNGTSVAVGVVLFTLILKLITLPFDFFSRASMRKNSVKMEEMRPELEKLQKQYAGDKTLYNQKMMALYKKNGYSMWGTCLPTILTLVIFIVAINGFNAYSQYINQEYFYKMSNAYNNVAYAGFDLDDNYICRDENGKLIVLDEKLLTDNPSSLTDKEGKAFSISINVNDVDNFYTLSTQNGYMEYKRYFTVKEGKKVFDGKTEYRVLEENLTNGNVIKTEENNFLKSESGKTFDVWKTDTNKTAKEFLLDIAELKSADCFKANNAGFLWVKNIWITDSPMKHPIISNDKEGDYGWSEFVSTYHYNEKSFGNSMTGDSYKELTAKLGDEKSAPNGFFILVVLTAGVSLLMQLITAKAQKAQMELQTVDGQGAQTQKIMTWMMPIMMAVFAFIYTAAFSIYIVISSLFSMLTTLVINYVVDKKYKSSKVNSAPIRGRVYTPKVEEKQEKPKKSKKNDDESCDFLNSNKKNREIKRKIK